MFANRKNIGPCDFQVLRNCIVTVIADCKRREVRWEVNGEPYPFKASFEKARFPASGTSFRFAVGGSSGGKTKIVDEKNEVITLLKDVENLREHPEFTKMKVFLEQALQQVESGGADRDFHFHYGPDHFDEVARICRTYIHACGFEDSEDNSHSPRFFEDGFFEDGCLVKLSADFASHHDAADGPLKPGDIGTVLKSVRGRCQVSVKGKEERWWYDEAALTTASASDAEAR